MARDLTFADPSDELPQASTLVLTGQADSADEVLAEFSDRLDLPLGKLLRREESDGPLTLAAVDHDTYRQVAWLDCGDHSSAARAAGAALAGGVSSEAVLVPIDQVTSDLLGAMLGGWLLAGYRYSLATRDKKQPGGLIVAADPTGTETDLSAARAACWARDLANTPSNIKSPEWLAAQVADRAKTAGLKVKIRSEDDLRRSGFGGILAVGGGSVRPPRLVELRSPGLADAPTVVLIGKGVTFDSGGLSLKPADSMPLMKTDMAGAAAVAAAMVAYAEDPGVNADATVVALLPMAENMPSGTSYRPGDVVRHYGGLTTEVSNTDAEGRLLLADCLAYAAQRWSPSVMVDIATLTGAATLGLSRHYAALYADDDLLAGGLVTAGKRSGDALWRMPLVAAYRRYLESDIADIAQTATDPTMRAGSITAALYLQRFVGDVLWAHIDMAGPGRADKPRGEHPVGATGFGARLLTDWLRNGDLAALA